MGNYTPDEVTDAMVERAWLAYDEAVETCAASDLPATLRVAMRAALTATLAQNTQGDGEPVPFCRVEDCFDNDSMLAQMGAKRGDKLYLHAERARVPDPETACAMWIKPDTTQAESDAFLAGARAMLAAAPSAPEGDGGACRG